MASVFDLQGNVVEKPEKDGYINHVFRLPSNGYNYGSSINLSLPPYVTKKAVLPQENLGWKIGDVITYQIPDNIYFNSDNSGGDVYFFVNENGANVSATPELYIEELKKHNIPNIESKLKEYIINFNKNIAEKKVKQMGGFPFGKKKEAATTREFFLSELNSTDTLKTLTSSNFKKEDIKKLISTFSDDEITNAEKATAAVEASPVEEEVAEAAAEAPAEEEAEAAEAEAAEAEAEAPAAEAEAEAAEVEAPALGAEAAPVEAPAAEAPAAEAEAPAEYEEIEINIDDEDDGEEVTAAAEAEAARLEMKLNEAKKTEEYATAALDGDYDSASEGDGVDMDVLERDEEAQKEAERKKKSLKKH